MQNWLKCLLFITQVAFACHSIHIKRPGAEQRTNFIISVKHYCQGDGGVVAVFFPSNQRAVGLNLTLATA